MIVADTNVILRGVRSHRGASGFVLKGMLRGDIAFAASPSFRFRPFLVDPRDDLFIECALAAGATMIVTDDRHFRHPGVAAFGLRAISAQEFVRENHQGASR